MKQEGRGQRHNEIAQAAYNLLAEKGFGGTSMLAIAKAARASNETMYRWYGDKLGLFRALIVDNAAAIKSQLEQSIAAGDDPIDVLSRTGPELLQLLTSDRAIALNRAAAADATGALGQALSEAGREAVAPLIGQVIQRLLAAKGLVHVSPQEAVGLYLDLLVGDLQIRRAIGVVPALDEAQCRTRSAKAFKRFCTLIGA